MLARDAIEFFLVAERGVLERQALLLCSSIRRFAGAYGPARVTVVSPRRDRRPSPATVKALDHLGAEYLDINLSSPCSSYGPSFKVLAASHVERRPGAPILVQLDSDTFFAGEPDLDLEGFEVAARPVDVKGMCTAGSGDRFDPYWRHLCRLCEVDYDRLPFVETTVDRQTVRASYNGGLVAVRRDSGIFERTETFFTRLVAARLKPWPGREGFKTGAGHVDTEASEYWGTSQAALSMAIAAGGSCARILSASHNVPLHSFDCLPLSAEPPVHIHYHWLCSEGQVSSNPMLDGRMLLLLETVVWLKQRVPLCRDPA
jgi:hypothetical protein